MYRSLLLLALATTGTAQAGMIWSSVDPSGHSGQGGHSGHGRPAREAITLMYGEGATTRLWLPTLEQRPLPLIKDVAQLKPSGMDNYHLLYAIRETEAVHETALRYHYLRGKPSGHSPAELIYAEKVPLEIVPAPLTREHARYLSEKSAAFMIRFQGKALADHPFMLETTNGTRLEGRSDAKGRIAVELPNDFQRVAIGRDNNPPAEFFLHTRYNNAGRDYQTSLSATYHVNPRHWESQSGALWSGLAGFVSGLGLLGFAARRNTAKG